MKNKVLVIGLLILLVMFGLMFEQHSHYAQVRVSAVQDYQDAFHGDVFHVLTFVRMQEDQDFMEPLAGLVKAANDTEAKLIYAGQVIHMGLRSRQITETFGADTVWNAVLVQQFDSQAAYQTYVARPQVQAAIHQFSQVYTHGFERSAALNVFLHQLFLAQRIWRRVTFTPDVLPFQPSPADDLQISPASGPLLQHADDLGRDAILIVNLARNGTPEEQAANADYAAEMLGLMADLRYGPMHIGSTVSLEHDHDFDQAMLVYYPGSQYFNDLSTSTWFQSIIGDKQLADTQACITVPITNLLLEG